MFFISLFSFKEFFICKKKAKAQNKSDKISFGENPAKTGKHQIKLLQ